ncbi:uncharacterized protein DFL_002378 [Arthrobotrys flagrans]|uniref:Uncharacterized protein n=1 Tax=Arthrobotrys flagrans TaxID=97331 RepID=A0A437AAA2_ARTFL|nr:hypothetical protein DFL_002378 [Arthrobotrys flagrans]
MPAVKQRKVAIVGSRAVGKSSLTVQFVENHFVESYYPTIENTFSTVIKYKGQDYSTEIVDTAGQDEYSILQSKHSIGIHGYLIAYSVTSRQSFDMVTVIRDKILNHLGSEWVPCVLVGNKSDLHIQRQVSPEEGKALAEEWKCSWTETSARHNENVAKAFELLIAEIEKSQNPAQPPNGGKCALIGSAIARLGQLICPGQRHIIKSQTHMCGRQPHWKIDLVDLKASSLPVPTINLEFDPILTWIQTLAEPLCSAGPGWAKSECYTEYSVSLGPGRFVALPAADHTVCGGFPAI